MQRSRSDIVERSREYERREPLYEVERDRLETLPDAFEDRSLVWKDVEWIVRWYYRRYLGDFPSDRRRRAEDRYAENSWEDVEETLYRAIDADESTTALERLLTLDGVNVPVASAILRFANPDEYVVVDDRAWGVLYRADELADPYPDPPSVEEYLAFRERCVRLAESFDVELQTLYRALWRIAGAEA